MTTLWVGSSKEACDGGQINNYSLFYDIRLLTISSSFMIILEMMEWTVDCSSSNIWDKVSMDKES